MTKAMIKVIVTRKAMSLSPTLCSALALMLEMQRGDEKWVIFGAANSNHEFAMWDTCF